MMRKNTGSNIAIWVGHGLVVILRFFREDFGRSFYLSGLFIFFSEALTIAENLELEVQLKVRQRLNWFMNVTDLK
jgi:hypothetical protein